MIEVEHGTKVRSMVLGDEKKNRRGPKVCWTTDNEYEQEGCRCWTYPNGVLDYLSNRLAFEGSKKKKDVSKVSKWEWTNQRPLGIIVFLLDLLEPSIKQ